MMFGGGVGLYVRRVGAGRCSSCSSISKALQMGMESDMEYAQGLSWTFRVPNGRKVADGGLQGLARVVCRFSPTGGLCNEFGNGSFGIRRALLRIGSKPRIPWFRLCHQLEVCFLRTSSARYLILRFWQLRRQMGWVDAQGRLGCSLWWATRAPCAEPQNQTNNFRRAPSTWFTVCEVPR